MSSAHVAFVTEGGPDVGLGHVSRCLALASAARSEGARVTFVVPPDPRVAALLRDRRVEAVPHGWPAETEGALEILRALGPGAIVVDSYKAAPPFLGALRALASPVVAVDDTAERPLPVDIVVNGSIAAESLPYARTGEAVFLLGSRYAPLDPAYADLPERRPAHRLGRILVTLGGGLNTTDVVAATRAADAALVDGAVEVATSSFGETTEALDDAARAARNRVTIHRDRFGLRDLMLSADLAVCGAGMTLYELAAAGTPAVTVCMADNQRPNAEAFARAGAAPTAGWAGEPELGHAIAAAIMRLAPAAARAEVAGRAHRLVDGRGAARVIRHILEPAPARR